MVTGRILRGCCDAALDAKRGRADTATSTASSSHGGPVGTAAGTASSGAAVIPVSAPDYGTAGTHADASAAAPAHPELTIHVPRSPPSSPAAAPPVTGPHARPARDRGGSSLLSSAVDDEDGDGIPDLYSAHVPPFCLLPRWKMGSVFLVRAQRVGPSCPSCTQ